MIAVLCLLLVGLWSLPAEAHRLDEYLQASTLLLSKDKATLEMRLTPGVSVAGQLIAAIDTNGDGVFSQSEQAAYASRVSHDVLLTVDGKPAPLLPVMASFPAPAALTDGMSDIMLRFEARAPSRKGLHHLTFANRHFKAFSVYLVNTVIPHDPTIRVTAQNRNIDQSVYRLDYQQAAVPASVSPAMSPLEKPPGWSLMVTFFWHGIRHILTGYDHLLFGLALALGAESFADLLMVITVFTVAHSITLTLAALGWIHVPSEIVEPIIAASIIFVALQNIVRPSSARGTSRLVAAFLFGLFHGLGFAGGLLDIMHQMPTGTVLLAILGFSVGIEAGNQLVLLPCVTLLSVIRRYREADGTDPGLIRWVRWGGSAVISVAGMFFLGSALATG